jgi:hypothetical protein
MIHRVPMFDNGASGVNMDMRGRLVSMFVIGCRDLHRDQMQLGVTDASLRFQLVRELRNGL